MDYKKLWLKFKGRLQEMEEYGNMLQQTFAQAFLDIMSKLEDEMKKENQ